MQTIAGCDDADATTYLSDVTMRLCDDAFCVATERQGPAVKKGREKKKPPSFFGMNLMGWLMPGEKKILWYFVGVVQRGLC